MNWKNRIVGHEVVPADQLLAHPANARRHPVMQRDALRGALKTIGWIGEVIVNQRTQRVLDGHLRCEEALRESASVPVTLVDLDEQEELLALATFDRIAGLAIEDHDAYRALVEQIQAPVDAALQALLASSHGGGAPAEVPYRFIVIRADDEGEARDLLAKLDPAGQAPTAEKPDLKKLARVDGVRLLAAGAVLDTLSSAQ